MKDQGTTPGRPLAPIAVCYLARFAEGTDPVRRFVESYEANPAGIGHELVILFKGFPGPSAKEPWREALSSLDYRELDFEDVGFDLTPYKKAADILEHEYFLFMNTWGHFLAPNWLALMYGHASKPGVAIVGATASYGSHLTIAYRRRSILWPKGRQPEFVSWLVSRFGRRAQKVRWMKAHFDPFPSFHIRTSGFLVRGDVFRKIHMIPINEKSDAYRVESGKEGITAQVLRMGLRALVVGRDGVAYGKDDAWKSNTYMQNAQENLLIADKQTDYYEGLDPEAKAVINLEAWANDAI